MQRLSKWFREEREKLASMPANKRWEYIWMYYKVHILVTVGVIVMSISLAQTVFYNLKEPLISGIFINTGTTPEGYAFVSEDYRIACGDRSNTRTEVVETRYIGADPSNPTSDDTNNIMAIDAMVSAKILDYAIVDEMALEFLCAQEIPMDLTTFLPAELAARLTLVETDFGTCAIDLTGSHLDTDFGLTASPSYLVCMVNTEHPESLISFLEYLFL